MSDTWSMIHESHVDSTPHLDYICFSTTNAYQSQKVHNHVWISKW